MLVYGENWYKEVSKVFCVSNPGVGIYKCFCTIIVIFGMEGEHPQMEIIFQVRGDIISSEFKNNYSDRIHIYLQPKVWYEREIYI